MSRYDVLTDEVLECKAHMRAQDVIRLCAKSKLPRACFVRSMLTQAHAAVLLTRVCHDCNNQNPCMSRFCNQCGAPQPRPEADPTLISVPHLEWGASDIEVDDLFIDLALVAPFITGSIKVVYHLSDWMTVGVAIKDGKMCRCDPVMSLKGLPEGW